MRQKRWDQAFRGLAVVCLLASLSCCSTKQQIESKEIYSPDKKLVLRIDIDESGGAAVSDVTKVYVLSPNDRKLAPKLIFDGSSMSSFTAEWRGPTLVELSYKDGFVSKCASSAAVLASPPIQISGCK
jgi:hypothetical protein